MVKKNIITVFGGSFDPVHNAHADIANEALKIPGVKKIIFVPAYAPPHKTKQFADIDDRLAMLKLVVKKIKNAEISFFEVEKQEPVYSYQTLDYFKSLYPDDEIKMVIGSDSLKDLDLWKNTSYLTSNYGFIVAKRPGAAVSSETKYFDKCVFIDVIMKDISSTHIRELLKFDIGKAKQFLDKDVFEYIREHGLYK